MTIHIGIIGYGGFGAFLDRCWSVDNGLQVTRIAESDPARHPVGDTRFTTDVQELLDDPALDVISIVTPPSSHAELAVAAMEAGKHVLIEKPVALSEADFQAILETRDRSGKRVAVNHMLRFNSLVEVLSNLAMQGILGDLRHASVENFAQDEDLPVDHWFWDSMRSGGILVEHAVHFIDLVENMTTAQPVSIKGQRRLRNDRQEDQVLATIAYDNHLVATHYHEFSTLKPFEITTVRLHFERARFELKGWIPLEGTVEALVDNELADALTTLPGWQETGSRKLNREPGSVRLAGKPYPAERILRGAFTLPDDKQTVYANCVRSMMKDLGKAIFDPSHSLRAPVEIGIRAVRTALAATSDARSL